MAIAKFEKVLQAASMNDVNVRSKDSREWLRNKGRLMRKAPISRRPTDTEIMKNGGASFRNRVFPGHMYMYYYDPKHKKTLPYYDMFPLIFPIEMRKDRFLGINMHYLPPVLRAKLMDALYDLATNTKMDETTRLKISYGILKSASKYKEFKPCVKWYLKKHVRSRFVKVMPEEWDYVLMLPLERFEKKNSIMVWKESRKIINK